MMINSQTQTIEIYEATIKDLSINFAMDVKLLKNQNKKRFQHWEISAIKASLRNINTLKELIWIITIKTRPV